MLLREMLVRQLFNFSLFSSYDVLCLMQHPPCSFVISLPLCVLQYHTAEYSGAFPITLILSWRQTLLKIPEDMKFHLYFKRLSEKTVCIKGNRLIKADSFFSISIKKFVTLTSQVWRLDMLCVGAE